MPNGKMSKPLTAHQIPFRKLPNFCNLVHKVKIYFAPFAIEVYLIQIDYGGDFFFLPGDVLAL